MTAARAALLAARVAGRRAAANPLAHMRWLPPQVALYRCTSHRKLLRCGNQAYGKTTAGLAELIWRCLGQHPFQPVPKAPIEAWIICASWSQSLAIQKKLWELVPMTVVRPGSRYDDVNGFGAHSPCLRFANGSIIRVKTTQQNALDLAGATIDIAMFDEPPKSSRLYGEIVKRVMARNGIVMLTLTPINAPVDWLRAECERGTITDLHFRLEPQYLIPEGAIEPHRLRDGTICDAAWIARIRAETMGHEDPIVNDGEWETRVEGRVFRAFRDGGQTPHVHTMAPKHDVKLTLGIDHGAGAGREVGILTAVDEVGDDPAVYVLDEYVSSGETTAREDARALIAMLRRHGFVWSDLDHCYGDKPYDKATGSKGNYDIEDALARELGLPNRESLKPRIWSAKRGARIDPRGDKARGVSWLHRRMVEAGRFGVHPRCKRLIESLNKWDYTDASEWKDAIDGLRYGLIPWSRGQRRRATQGPTMRVA